MKAQANQTKEIIIEDSDDDGPMDFKSEKPARTRRKRDVGGKRKGMKGKTNKMRADTKNKKRVTVFDLDDDSDEDGNRYKVTSKDIQSNDPACLRAQELLALNRKILMQGGQSEDEEEKEGEKSDKHHKPTSNDMKSFIVSDDDDMSEDDSSIDDNRSARKKRIREKVAQANEAVGKTVTLKLRTKDNNILARIRTTDPLKKALEAFCRRFKLDASKAKLEIDGDIVGDDETPDTYDLEDRSIVEVLIED